MIKPHGSDQLNPLFVYEDAQHRALTHEAQSLPSMLLSSAVAANAVMMGSGYFNPLTGYMNLADALSVARVESHAAGCADCARALAAARGHRRRLRRLGDTARMPDEARDRVLHLLRGVRGSSSR